MYAALCGVNCAHISTHTHELRNLILWTCSQKFEVGKALTMYENLFHLYSNRLTTVSMILYGCTNSQEVNGLLICTSYGLYLL